MQKNVGSQKAIFFAFDATTNLPKTGDAGNITPYESLDYGSVTGITDTSMTEMDSTNAKGYYICDLTQAETNANTILFSAKSSTSNIVVVGAPAVVQTVPASFVVAPGSSGGILVGGSNAATTISGLTTGALACTTITASGAVAFQSTFAVTTSTSLAAVTASSITNAGTTSLQGVGMTSLANSGTTTLTGLSTGALSTSSITNAGTLTQTGATTFTGAITATNAGNDIRGVLLSGTQTFNLTGNITGNLSGSVGSVTGNVGGNVVGSVGSVSGAVGSVTGNVGGNVVGSVGSVAGAVGSVTDVSNIVTGGAINVSSGIASADIKKVNAVTVTGNGSPGTEWGP